MWQPSRPPVLPGRQFSSQGRREGGGSAPRLTCRAREIDWHSFLLDGLTPTPPQQLIQLHVDKAGRHQVRKALDSSSLNEFSERLLDGFALGPRMGKRTSLFYEAVIYGDR